MHSRHRLRLFRIICLIPKPHHRELLSSETMVPFQRVRVHALTYTTLGIDAIEMTTMSRRAATPRARRSIDPIESPQPPLIAEGAFSALTKQAGLWTLEPPRRLPVRRAVLEAAVRGYDEPNEPPRRLGTIIGRLLARTTPPPPATNHQHGRRTPKNPAIPQSHSPLDPLRACVAAGRLSVRPPTRTNHRPDETPGGAARGTGRAGKTELHLTGRRQPGSFWV